MKSLAKIVLASTLAVTGLGVSSVADISVPGLEAKQASAASVSNWGVSLNPIKDNFYIGTDEFVLYSIQNNNSYEMLIVDVLQKYNPSTNTWANYSTQQGEGIMAANGKYRQGFITPSEPGTYRFKVYVFKQNTHPFLAENKLGALYSSKIYVH